VKNFSFFTILFSDMTAQPKKNNPVTVYIVGGLREKRVRERQMAQKLLIIKLWRAWERKALLKCLFVSGV